MERDFFSNQAKDWFRWDRGAHYDWMLFLTSPIVCLLSQTLQPLDHNDSHIACSNQISGVLEGFDRNNLFYFEIIIDIKQIEKSHVTNMYSCWLLLKLYKH